MPKEGAKRARMIIKRAQVRMPKAKERREKENRKERKVIARAKAKAKTRKGQGHLARDCWGNTIRQVANAIFRRSISQC